MKGWGRRALNTAVGMDIRRRRWAVAKVIPTAGPRLLAGTAAAGLVSAILPTLFTIATGALVGGVPAAVRGGLDSPAGRHVQLMLLILVLLFIAQQLARPIFNVFAGLVSQRVTTGVHQRVMAAALGPPGIAHLEEPALLDKIDLARGAGTSEIGPGAAAWGLISVWVRRLQGLSALIVITRFSPWLALFLAVQLGISYRLYLRGFAVYMERFVAKEQQFRRAAYFRDLGTEGTVAKESRVFGLGGWMADQYERHYRSGMEEVWKRRRKESALQAVPTLLDTIGVGIAFLFVARAAVDGAISLGELTTYAGAIAGTIILVTLGNEELLAMWGSASVTASTEFVETVAERSTPASVAPAAKPAAGLPRREIRFKDVTFAYPGGNHEVFTGLDLTIPAGHSLAIVGANGAGKTTLVKLLAGLYPPTAGRITVDDVDVATLDPAQWQRRIAAIFQDFTRYEAYNLADNIGLGAVEHIGDREAIEQAAERAGVATLAATLPEGWETKLGRQFSGGTELSGGQWQRIALARALFATQAGAGVLVLDEPTANLDVRGETELYDRFLELTRGVTTIVISHRFSTVRRADRIVVLEEGRVVEDGDHAALLANRGRYAEMFNLQASRYEDEPSLDG